MKKSDEKENEMNLPIDIGESLMVFVENTRKRQEREEEDLNTEKKSSNKMASWHSSN